MTSTEQASAPAVRDVALRPARIVRSSAVGGLGLITMVAGSFLPWLRSGSVDRNSYATDGLLRRLMSTDELTHLLLVVWPFLSGLSALALALLILGLGRSGWVLSVASAVAVGIVAVRVLAYGPLGVVGIVTLGPAVTLAGAAIVLVAWASCVSHLMWNRTKRGNNR